MKTLITLLKTALTLALTACTPSAKSATTALYFTSSLTSYVGLGKTDTVTPSPSQFYVNATFSNDAVFWSSSLPGGFGLYDLLSLQFMSRPGFTSEFYSLRVGTSPGDDSFGVGRYEDAERFGTLLTVQPHLSFAMDGRGNNNTAGWFEVLEWQTGPGDEVIAAAIDFYQLDEKIAGKWVAGSWRYNSSVPLNTSVPEPSRAMLILIGAAGLMARRRRSLA